MYDHGLTDISEQMYSNLSMFYDGLNVQITWETSLHCHVIAMETKDRIKIKYQLTCQSYYSNIHLNVIERTEIMKPMGLKKSLDKLVIG